MSLEAIRALERAVSEGQPLAKVRLEEALVREGLKLPRAQVARQKFAALVNDLAHAVNGRASARTVGGATIAALVREVAQQKVGEGRSDTGGTVSKRYLRENAASTTVCLVRRVPRGVRVVLSREKISQYDPDKTYSIERQREILVPLKLIQESAS